MPILPPPYAIDLGEQSVKVILLARRPWWEPPRGIPRIIAASERDIPEGWIRNGEIREPRRLADFLRTVLGRTGSWTTRSRFAVAALPEHRTFITTIRVRPESGETPAAAARRNLASALPIDPSQAAVVTTPLPNHGGSSEHLAVASAPADLAESYAALLEAAGCTPIALDSEAAAIARAIAFRPRASAARATPFLALDFGATRTHAIIANGDTVAASITNPLSGARITAAVAGALRIASAAAERAKRSVDCTRAASGDPAAAAIVRLLEPLLDDLAQLDRFAKTHLPPSLHPQRVVLTGGGASLPGLDRTLHERLGLPVDRFSIPAPLRMTARTDTRAPTTMLATVFGLGLLAFDPIGALAEPEPRTAPEA